MPKRTSKEYDRFVALTDRLLAVPHAEIQKRVAQHREAAAKNPRKRGPKPKRVVIYLMGAVGLLAGFAPRPAPVSASSWASVGGTPPPLLACVIAKPALRQRCVGIYVVQRLHTGIAEFGLSSDSKYVGVDNATDQKTHAAGIFLGSPWSGSKRYAHDVSREYSARVSSVASVKPNTRIGELKIFNRCIANFFHDLICIDFAIRKPHEHFHVKRWRLSKISEWQIVLNNELWIPEDCVDGDWLIDANPCSLTVNRRSSGLGNRSSGHVVRRLSAFGGALASFSRSFGCHIGTTSLAQAGVCRSFVLRERGIIHGFGLIQDFSMLASCPINGLSRQVVRPAREVTLGRRSSSNHNIKQRQPLNSAGQARESIPIGPRSWFSIVAGIACWAVGLWLGYIAGGWFERGMYGHFVIAMAASVTLFLVGLNFVWHL